jgi:hypothetical protein
MTQWGEKLKKFLENTKMSEIFQPYNDKIKYFIYNLDYLLQKEDVVDDDENEDDK